MDQNSSDPQVTLQLSQEQPVSEEPKSLVKMQCMKLLFILFVSSLVGTVIGFGFYSQRETNPGPVPCLSPACLSVAEHFSTLNDPFSRPCDYFLFTCGADKSTLSRGRQRGKVFSTNVTTGQDRKRWTGEGEGGRIEQESGMNREGDLPDRFPDRLSALLQTIKEILDSLPRGVAANSAEEKAQRFYKTCMDSQTAENKNSDRFLALIQQLGGWAISGRWTQPDFNSTLVQLMAQYNTFPFFNVYVGPDRREGQANESQLFIQIDQPDFLFPIDWNSNVQRSKINTKSVRPFLLSCRQLLALLDAPPSDTTKHCGLYVSLCSTLVTATSPLSYRFNQKLLYHRVTIQELQLLVPAINWLYALQAIFHPLPVSQSDFVLLHNLPYIMYMSQTISSWKHKDEMMGSHSLHTYMVLTLLQTLIPALDSRFSQVMKNFSLASNNREEEVPHWKHCVLQTAKGFDTLLSHMIKQLYVNEEAEELVQDIYSALNNTVVHLSWRDEETQHFVLNKVTSLTPRLSTEALDQLSLNQHYAEVIINEKDYFSNYLQLLVLQQRRRSRMFSLTAQHDVLSISPFVSGNNIIIPVGLFVSPLFHSSYPRAINYGMLGSLIAKDLLRLLLPDIISQSDNVGRQSECVWLQYISGREGPDMLETSLSQSQQQEVWVQYSALNIAIEAYHMRLERLLTDTSVSGLSYSHLFLSSFIQASCGSEPYRAFMPFEPSFLVTALCRKTNVCPKSLICKNKSLGPLPKQCLEPQWI